MNLKKAFQYQKALKELEKYVAAFMLDTDIYLKITEIHCKSEVNSMNSDYNFTDETKDLSNKHYGKYEFAKVLRMYTKLVEWRTNLARGIALAKAKVAIGPNKLTYDAAIVYANDQREVLWNYGQFAELERIEDDKEGSMHVTTDMGDATVNYNIKKTTVPTEGVVDMAFQVRLKLQTELDDLSDAIEAAALGTQLPGECVPPIPLNIKADELYTKLEKYL